MGQPGICQSASHLGGGQNLSEPSVAGRPLLPAEAALRGRSISGSRAGRKENPIVKINLFSREEDFGESKENEIDN